MRAWWLLAFFTRFAGAAPDLLFHAPDGRVPTFAPRPPVPNPVDDPDWLVAASGFCSDFSFAPDGSIDFKFHPEVSVAFTDAPFHQAASLEAGIEIRGEEYSQTDVLAAGTWTNKNVALLEPTSSCDDPPAGSQDEWAISVFKVTGNEACGEECVHFSGLVSGASDNFVARKEGRFLCQLFVESHTFPDQARRSLRRRLTSAQLVVPIKPVPIKPTVRQTAFAPLPEPPDGAASWLIAAAGICSALSVTPNNQYIAAESAADQRGTFIADITFKFHPETSVAYTKSPEHGAIEIGDEGIRIGDKEYSAMEILASDGWNLKNIALLQPISSCDDPPAGSQDEWGISTFKVASADMDCGEGGDCVRYSGQVSAMSSTLASLESRKGRFPCQLYVDSYVDGCCEPCKDGCAEEMGDAGYTCKHTSHPVRKDGYHCGCADVKDYCTYTGAPPEPFSPPPPPPMPPPLNGNVLKATVSCSAGSCAEPVWELAEVVTGLPDGTCDPTNPNEGRGDSTVRCPDGNVVYPPKGAGAASPFLIGSYNDYGATELAMSPPAWSTTGFTILQYPNLVCPDGNRDVLSAEECEGLASANGLTFERSQTDDANWIGGCFQWYDIPFVAGGTMPTVGYSQKVYWNDRFEWSECAKEGGYCKCPGGRTRYGAGSTWVSKAGSQSCDNDNFGDPAYGTAKTCECGAPFTKGVYGGHKICSSTCYDADWWPKVGALDVGSTAEDPYAVCGPGFAMAGLYRRNCNELYCLTKVRCCPVSSAVVSSTATGEACTQMNIRKTFDNEGWGQCDDGYYMKGMWRSKGEDDYDGDLGIYHLEELTCCRNEHANTLADCKEHSIESLFDDADVWAICPNNKVMKGLYRSGNKNDLSNIEKLMCCNVVPTPRALRYGPHEYGYDATSCKAACDGYRFLALQDGGWCSCDNDWTRVKMYGSIGPHVEVLSATYGANCRYSVSCQQRDEVVWATCNGKPVEKWGFDSRYDMNGNIANCNYAHSGDDECQYTETDNELSNLIAACGGTDECYYKIDATLIGDPAVGCAKDYDYTYKCSAGDTSVRQVNVPGEASGSTVVIQCASESTQEGACGPDGGSWCNAVYDTSLVGQQPPTDPKGNWLCLAPADGTMCNARDTKGIPDYTPCSVSFTCDNGGSCSLDDAECLKYQHKPLEACPKSTWSCVAFNAEHKTAGAVPILSHSTLPHSPTTDGDVPCWFPSRSPLSLMLSAPLGTPSSDVILPEAESTLARQCEQPPFVFAYFKRTVMNTYESPGLVPPPFRFDCGDELEIDIQSYPDVSCPVGYRDVPSEAECQRVAEGSGLTWAGTLTNDGNWISGCFEWYEGSGDPVGTSTKVYWNDRLPEASTGNIGGHKICEFADTNTKLYIYDDTIGSVERWDEVCGDIFWNASKATYDWPTLLADGAVSGCVGSKCTTASQSGGRALNELDNICEICKLQPDKCSLDSNLYAIDLVHASQFRVADILEGVSKGAPLEQVGEAKGQLRYMVDSLVAYRQANGQVYSEGLLNGQVASIGWASNVLNVWAQGILQGNSSGYVPSFNLEFYGEKLSSYFDDFDSLIQEMKKMKALSEINELIKTKHAINAAAEESITKVSMAQTMQTIESAASGMTSALTNWKRLNETIVEAGFDFQKALDDYYAQLRKQAIWNLAFGVANLCVGGGRTFANIFEYKVNDGCAKETDPAPDPKPEDPVEDPEDDIVIVIDEDRRRLADSFNDDDEFFDANGGAAVGSARRRLASKSCKKQGADAWSSVGFFVETVGSDVKTMGYAVKAFKTNEDNTDDNSAVGASSEAYALTNEVIESLTELDVLLPTTGCDSFTDCDIPNGTEMAALQAALDTLNEELPTMGWGFWTEYFAVMKENYNEFLTGYTTSINGAAQHVIDLIDAQKDYGNDYVNQGMRYVGGLQQYLIDAQTISISATANDALETAYSDTFPENYFALQQATQALQVTSLALQMQALALQLCQSYSYQTTGLFQRCVARSTAPMNPLQQLCYNISIGVHPSLNPMIPGSCSVDTENATGFYEEVDRYLAPYAKINDLARAVNCYVDQVLWGEGSSIQKAVAYPFAALKVEVFNASCTPFEPPSFVTNMTSCVASDCPCFDSECDDDAVLKCFPASGAECQAFNATLDGGFAEDETCCVSRYETLTCTSPPRVEPTYNDDGMLILDGYTKPYITEAQLKNFSDPDSLSFGKLVIDFPVAYMRQIPDVGTDKDEVFVRGIAAYLEGATIREGKKFKVSLTATGEMTNQVVKYPVGGPHECPATSCLFDDYSFAGAPSGQQYCSSPERCNPPSTLVYVANYWNAESETSCGRSSQTPQRVFTGGEKAKLADSPDELFYCTDEDYTESYENAALQYLQLYGENPKGPYNSASLFSSFELTVTSSGDASDNWGIDLSGVTAIHIGFWLMTTDADETQCSNMCSAAFTGEECSAVQMSEFC